MSKLPRNASITSVGKCGPTPTDLPDLNADSMPSVRNNPPRKYPGKTAIHSHSAVNQKFLHRSEKMHVYLFATADRGPEQVTSATIPLPAKESCLLLLGMFKNTFCPVTVFHHSGHRHLNMH